MSLPHACIRVHPIHSIMGIHRKAAISRKKKKKTTKKRLLVKSE